MNQKPAVIATEEEGVFWTQLKAKAGHYYDRTGYPSLEMAQEGKKWEEEHGQTCRIVTKTINVVG